jgi:hypothetical protein
LWESGRGIVFHGPEVCQERNLHSLIKDFEAEVPGYLRNTKIVQTLEGVRLISGTENMGDNVLKCYEALVKAGICPPAELLLVEAWLFALNELMLTKSKITR